MSDTLNTDNAIDHDGLFKELVRSFTYEFLLLFAYDLATEIDPATLEFLDKELFHILDNGDKKEVDLLIKAQFRGKTVYFLIHIEVQSTSSNWSPKRMFHYTARLFERFDMPIYPIALLTWDKPKKEAENYFAFSFPSLNVLQFNFHTIQLNQLNWRDYMRLENPVATALMAKMNIAEEDRVQVKLEILRMITTLKINPAKSALIWQFMETYLTLNAQQEQLLQQKVKTEFPPQQQEKMRLYNTSYHEKGRAEGLQEGILLGIQQGKAEGKAEGEMIAKRAATVRLIVKRFGASTLSHYQANLDGLSSAELDEFFDAALSFVDEKEIGTWFALRN